MAQEAQDPIQADDAGDYDLLADFGAHNDEQVMKEIEVYYLTEGIAGALPQWWTEFEQRRNIAGALNCPVWCIGADSVYPLWSGQDDADTIYAIAQFVCNVRTHLQQYSPQQKAEFKQQIVEQIQAAMQQAIASPNQAYPDFGSSECKNDVHLEPKL